MTYRIAWTILIGLSIGLAGCSDSPSQPQSHRYPQDREQEAQLAALCLSGELRPPAELSLRVQADLARIREDFGRRYAVLDSVEFAPPWVPGCLILYIDAGTARLIRDGEYSAWNQLNRRFRVSRIDTNRIDRGWVVVWSSQLLHPRRMAGSYDTLPGVTGVESNGFGGDGPRIYPRSTGDEHTYLFRNAWGDCLAGCASSEYWYFAMADGEARLLGRWSTEDSTDHPAWWDDAMQNIELYRQW